MISILPVKDIKKKGEESPCESCIFESLYMCEQICNIEDMEGESIYLHRKEGLKIPCKYYIHYNPEKPLSEFYRLLSPIEIAVKKRLRKCTNPKCVFLMEKNFNYYCKAWYRKDDRYWSISDIRGDHMEKECYMHITKEEAKDLISNLVQQ